MNCSKTIKAIKAYHFVTKEKFDTTREAFYAIKRDGYIRPRNDQSERRKTVEVSDWVEFHSIAGDSRYAFFIIDERLLTVPDNFLAMSNRVLVENQLYDIYGFVFDAIELIAEHSAFVGPDLIEDYNNLMCEIASEVDNTLLLPSIDKVAINQMSRQMRILHGMAFQDESVPGVPEALQLFYERVKRLQENKRCSGTKAIEVVKQNRKDERVLDLLIANKISTHQAIGTVEGGIYRTSLSEIHRVIFGKNILRI